MRLLALPVALGFDVRDFFFFGDGLRTPFLLKKYSLFTSLYLSSILIYLSVISISLCIISASFWHWTNGWGTRS